MTAKECITGRRSIRQYTDQPVSHELLAQIVETASYAPSWKHTQIVRYIAVEGEKKAKLAACTSSFPGNGKIMENAPMVVAVTVIKGRSGFERDPPLSLPPEAMHGRCSMPVLPAKHFAWLLTSRALAP